LIETTAARAKDSGAGSVDEVRRHPARLAALSEAMAAENARLKKFLIAHLYTHPIITEDRDYSVACLERLFRRYQSEPGSMPPDHEEQSHSRPRHVVVCDYIAGMTDQFLLKQYREHFGTFSASAEAAP
jgi:dGTPase